MFMQPSHPPGRDLSDSIRRDLGVIEGIDRLGFAEVWVGEHLSAPWEPVPACDLLLARAIDRTDAIALCTGAYVTSFYHPAALAHRIMQLDHMCEGRFMCGLAAGSVPTDFPLVGVDPASGDNRAMLAEAIDIMVSIWTRVEEPWEHRGRFWTVANPAPQGAYRPWLRPFQRPHPPVAIASVSPESPSMRYAGEKGFVPMSLTFNVEYLKGHWTQVEAGAAAAGRAVDRGDWRLVREIHVAETDAEARAWARSGHMAGQWVAQNLPLLRKTGWVRYLKHDPSVPDDAVDVDYLIEHLWLVGSPKTVADKLVDVHGRIGGFGTILYQQYDYGDDQEAYMHSLELFSTEVLPAVNRRVGDGGAT